MKRVLALILVCLFAVTVFAGCGGSGDTNEVSSVDPNAEINFAADKFPIIRPADNADVNALAVSVLKAVKQGCNAALKNMTDEATENAVGEILIGNTNRKQSKKALDLIFEGGKGKKGDYIIAFIDGKIVINAMTDEALTVAVNKFIELYCTTGKMKAADKVLYCDSSSDYVDIMINGVHASRYDIILPKYNISYLVVSRVEELVNLINEKGGYAMKISRDNVAESEYEIVIGDCNREGVETVSEYQHYVTQIKGNKIFVNGGRNYAIASALQTVIDNFKSTNQVKFENSDGYYSANLEYNYVWSDEFDDATFNTSVWNAQNSPDPAQGGWYGLVPYRSSSSDIVYLADGKMHQAAKYDDKYFYGTFLTTKSKVMFTNGLSEVSSKLADGAGLWHCFWLWDQGTTPTDDLLEFDVMECWSGANYHVSVIHETVDGKLVDEATSVNEKHSYVTIDSVFKNDSGSDFWAIQKKDFRPERLMSEQFHTHAVLWDEEKVEYYRDGHCTLSYTYKGTENEFLYKNPHYIILSLNVGSNKGRYDDDIDNDSKEMSGVKRPILEADYWNNGKNIWTIEYVQLFQKQGSYFKLG